MCLVMLGWQRSVDYPVIIGANRDERFDRPSSPIGWWEDHSDILAGRDLTAGGTWLGISRNGRFGIITNFRDPKPMPALRSRGELITRWLSSDISAANFQRQLETDESTYAGYNLLYGDLEGLHYFSNRNTQTGALVPNSYALSNAVLDTPWPKVVGARAHLDTLIASKQLHPAHFMTFLQSQTPAPDRDLPETNLPLEQRRLLSAPFIVGERYGTRCSTVVTIDRHGRVAMHEQHYAPLGQRTEQFDIEFQLGS